MEGRNFRTAVFGGFRKKDVISFLAEDKSQQEEVLQDLRQQLEEAEAQVRSLMAQRDHALEQVQLLRADADRAQEDTAAARRQAEDASARQAALEEHLHACEQENASLQQKNAALQDRNAALETQLAARADLDGGELQALREELQTQRRRAEELETKVQQQPRVKSMPAESTDQLWALCGKMERTLGQMERMLDGPYRMTCYPEPPEERAEPVEIFPAEGASCAAEPAPQAEAPAVKNLLQRIRVKR